MVMMDERMEVFISLSSKISSCKVMVMMLFLLHVVVLSCGFSSPIELRLGRLCREKKPDFPMECLSMNRHTKDRRSSWGVQGWLQPLVTAVTGHN